MIFQDGAFDEAVKGVDGIIHTASPFSPTVETAEGDYFITLSRLKNLTRQKTSSALQYAEPLEY